MRYLTLIGISTALCLGTYSAANAQDSDPGMGSMGAMRSASSIIIADDVYENNLIQAGLAHTFAKGEHDVALNISHVEFRAPVQGLGYIDIKLPFYGAKGDLANTVNLGDLQLSYTHLIADPETFTWQFTGGFRIGTGTASASDGKSRSLPMVYQASQGTTDVMVGASMMYKKYFSVALGYQQPIIRYNENQYNRSTPLNDAAYSNSQYPMSSRLYRNGDVMMRVEGHLTGKRAGISAGPLAFYHLRNDLYTDFTGKYREAFGSEGFTLNVAGNAFYRFGRYGEMKFDVSGGFPVVQNRDQYPDGFRREWVVTPRFTFYFGQRVLLF